MIIRLDHVTKRYGALIALDDVSLEVRPGAIGLLGPNGAGKSTLIKMLLGLVRFTSGNASVLDHDVRRDSRAIRQRVGYMPEDDCTVAGLKGVEMVAYAGQLAGMYPRTALRRAHEMLDYVLLHDERYREVQTYSTGMRQRIKLALALVHSPKLLFLDEPTSGMDPQGREQILRMVRSLAHDKGVSVVVSTHILKDVEASCESVVILGHGKVLVYDELETLCRSVDNAYHVRIDGDRQDFATALERRGFEAELPGEDELTIRGHGDVSAAVFELARERGQAVRQVTPSRNSLEDIFLKAVRGEHADL